MELFKGIYNKENMLVKKINEQNEIFELIDSAFSKIPTSITSNDELYKERINNNLNAVVDEAYDNNIPMQDYIAHLFFKGQESLVPDNMYIASCWALYAGANGSKVSLSRISTLLTPAKDYIFSKVDRSSLYDTYNLTDEIADDFISSHISNVLVYLLKINIETLKQMVLKPEDFPEVTILDIEDVRDANLNKMVDYLGL